MIRDIKKEFQTAEAYAVYAACMYEPTYEKFIQKTTPMLADPDTRIYGFFQGELLLGIIAVQRADSDTAEIKGIAVRETHRRRRIGSGLVDDVMRHERLTALFAETDDDGVLFYRRCGFETEAFSKEFDGVPCRRYRCVCRTKP